MMRGGSSENGFRVYRASRLEALIAPLWGLLQQTWPANILQPHTVVAAHPGMKQWLVGALARHQGPQGIAANLEIMLPSTWIERLAHRCLGEGAVALPRYQVAQLRWSIHALLDPEYAVPGVCDARVASYLSGEGAAAERALRRFQLADRMARMYSQYLVYRPDWLQAWEAGKFTYAGGGGVETEWLAPLWHALQARLGRHRGHAMQALTDSLRTGPQDYPALHLFGVSHLAPAEIRVLRAYAEHALVAWYVPDPCREFWGGLKISAPAAWSAYRADEQCRMDAAGEGEYWRDQDHPLLARWGRLGQHFFSQLADGPVREDIRHWQDHQTLTTGNRLQRVQESIRQLSPGLLRNDSGLPTERHDASLRIHACHTRQRELEVLRDGLLAALAEGIAPGDMMVMAPDISAYLPLIPSVFGEAASTREKLPYHLADVPVATSHGLFEVLRRLLHLPGQRTTAQEVADLLAVPEIQRRLRLDAASHANLLGWLRQSRVAWSLDAAHRASFDVPARSEHGFAWAVERMLAGYLASDAPESEQVLALPDGSMVFPVSGIHGPDAAAVGALDQLLREIQAWHDLAHRECSAAQWCNTILVRLNALLSVDLGDDAANAAWNTMQGFVRQLELEVGGSGESLCLHFAVMREVLLERLSGVFEQQRFLMGGITFCGMVPQRAIPFRMLAVLGLNDGEFPRQRSDGGLDLMKRLRRVGDRDVRSDDRYLFLETVMAARDRLHLSYLGISVKDGKLRNPAAPLAELMAELDAGSPETRPWFIKHPLQPFDARYFDGRDPRLFSYDARYAGMHGNGRVRPPRFLDGAPAAQSAMPTQVDLAILRDYYNDPARHVLERRLQLHLDALKYRRLEADEPMGARLDPLVAVARRVFFNEALPVGLAWDASQIPDWVRWSGLLPLGALGLQAWQHEAAVVSKAMARVQASAHLDVASMAQASRYAVSHSFMVAAQSCRINGRIDGVYGVAGGAPGQILLRLFPEAKKGDLKSAAELDFGKCIAVFLDWAMLRLQTASDIPVQLFLLCKEEQFDWQDTINHWDRRYLQASLLLQANMRTDLEARVSQLLLHWHQAGTLPPLYFARTSWAAVQGNAERSAVAAQKVWNVGTGGRGERNYGLGYNALLAGDIDFEAEPDAYQALHEFAMALKEIITLPEAP